MKYSIVIKWSKKDDEFIAVVPELQGLSAFGNTPLEVVQELMIAQGPFISAMLDNGQTLPEPDTL